MPIPRIPRLHSAQPSRRKFLVGLGFFGAVAVVGCGGGAAAPPTSSGAAAPAPADPNTIMMTDANKYVPDTLTVAKGATVTFQNSSTVIHSATDDPAKAVNKADAQLPSGATPWDSGLLQPAQKWTHSFDVAGTYKFFCVPHETMGMLGTITVQ